MLVSKTPFRISLFGGGTDFEDWFINHGGQVLSTTINKYCYISIRNLPPFFTYKHRIVWSKIELKKSINDIEHPAVREGLKLYNPVNGIEIHHVGDLPARSGLGSSSSFSVGLINVLNNFFKKEQLNKYELSKKAIDLEHKAIKEVGGVQDQIQVAHGGINHLKFLKSGEYIVSPLNLESETKNKLEQNLLLFYTGTVRNSHDIAVDKKKKIPENYDVLKKIYNNVDNALDILHSSKSIDNLGKLMHKNWLEKIKLSKGVSNQIINETYKKAINAGALGGKILGAGGGGFFCFYVPLEKQNQVKEDLKHLIEVPFSFEFDGTKILNDDQNSVKFFE